MAKTPGLKAPKFGGKPKMSSRSASKKVQEQFGPVRKKSTATDDMNVAGNREFGFIQSTPKLASGAMSGRGLPPLKGAKTSTRSDGRSQFKAKGRKVF